ncbi:MAG: hypothetical protein K9K67_10160 [Bacteriovoracaceae bacterium]|nr:hypothetical protein [Bacteriovoracaceae bacterium]
MKITEITIITHSTGSIDPSSHAYGTSYVYNPTIEESNGLLDEILVNDKTSLRMYFQAHYDKDMAFLKSIKKSSTDNNQTMEKAKGGSTTIWFIKSGEFSIESSDKQFKINKFPTDLVHKKGKKTGMTMDMLELGKVPSTKFDLN